MSTSITFRSGNKLETITFDSTTSIRPTFRNEVSKHPVEQGSTATDNSRKEPAAVSIEGLLTDFPLTIRGGGVGGAGEKGRAGGVLDLLLYLKDKGVRVTLRTTLRSYSNMVIESVSPNSDRLKGAIKVAITFTEVQIVASEVVDIQRASNRIGQGKAEKGKQNTTEATPKERGKSWAASGVDQGSGLIEQAKALLKVAGQ